MRFLLDEMISTVVEQELIERGIEARAVVGDISLASLPDEDIFDHALQQRYVLVTANVRDLRSLAIAQAGVGGHLGIVFVLGDVPRSRFSWLADHLERIATEAKHDDALRNQELWL